MLLLTELLILYHLGLFKQATTDRTDEKRKTTHFRILSSILDHVRKESVTKNELSTATSLPNLFQALKVLDCL